MSLDAPLSGVHVVEFEGLGPGPLAGWMLAGMGARITLVARPAGRSSAPDALRSRDGDLLREGKTIVELDLKSAAGRDAALDLVAHADALIEGLRPGAMERVGLGPDACARRNPKLVYARMTGWGQHGPLASAAGHDLNYVALTGMLSLSAPRDGRPGLPPTVVGDAGGALGLAFGIACALFDVRAGGPGRVVDGAIVDIVSMLGTLALWARASGQLDGAQPSLFHDAPFYDVYRCADGEWVTIGALEPPFYALLIERLGLADVDPASQYDRTRWPALKARFAEVFAQHPSAHWRKLLEGTDACFAPVLSVADAANHPHNVARGVYRTDRDGNLRARVAPRFMPLNDDSA
ncbi:CoA transferase [Burkholderia multivorans]|uniref:Alpha-methylacyl-CoA racemase (2-methylacyl-CoAracemase) (2-arylpropionyl-CoA epimerase) n=1 Tax=Burkholderia multivorans CGD2 TaxID=513052 RepID=B9BYS4_9BURK|nr:CaiB/BaiF CoA-transferase family protein [Burkholderia multivorans]EEE04145.1 alpha-methylacyl-CoA racemase (2-methylacyl-CoAracemase) (2-arylpropionyl-CoA epimerase) [Burkholderia multivorans CGD2]EEE11661.1 alpha-methylacyl-CoA racemase (2-methylacyl-CoAracemase) (2-arylpropionyl-CoA epimerase) [Burkholderia multivorans CGD2M]MBU9181999.1 CoA transferase [Burkholderia multivorans]MCL4663925.1 CoA transferase [Burkholderia multivorans]MCO1355319.1 CoA transferase [Burkholderia multivorans]